jgi:ABC-type uncharacterized transport system permease subunit
MRVLTTKEAFFVGRSGLVTIALGGVVIVAAVASLADAIPGRGWLALIPGVLGLAGVLIGARLFFAPDRIPVVLERALVLVGLLSYRSAGSDDDSAV